MSAPTPPGPTPDVSIIMPVLDGEDTIAVQLDALRAQHTTAVWELLICDNGSTDRTASIVRGYADRDARVRLVDAGRRRGPSAARNVGAAEAAAPLLAFCDADDQADPDWLGTIVDALGEVDIVCGIWEPHLLSPANWRSISWTPQSEYRKSYLPDLPAGAANNMGMRAAAFHDAGGFDESMFTGEDADLIWRAELAGHGFRFLPDAVMHIRRRRGLRATWKQAVSYGRGEFRLRHKYEKVIAAYAAEAASRPPEDTEPAVAADRTAAETPTASGRRAGPLRRFVRGGFRLHIADRLWRTGLRRGDDGSVVEPGWTQVEPPLRLPHY